MKLQYIYIYIYCEFINTNYNREDKEINDRICTF